MVTIVIILAALISFWTSEGNVPATIFVTAVAWIVAAAWSDDSGTKANKR